MTETWRPDRTESLTIEVRVHRGDELIARELCESEAEAEQVLEKWAEIGGVFCEVDDLSFRHQPGDVLESEPAEVLDEDYPSGSEPQ